MIWSRLTLLPSTNKKRSDLGFGAFNINSSDETGEPFTQISPRLISRFSSVSCEWKAGKSENVSLSWGIKQRVMRQAVEQMQQLTGCLQRSWSSHNFREKKRWTEIRAIWKNAWECHTKRNRLNGLHICGFNFLFDLLKKLISCFHRFKRNSSFLND